MQDTKQSNVTRQMQKNTKVISSRNNNCSTENVLNWSPSCLWLLQCCQTSFPLQNQEQHFEDHPELPWLDVHCMVHCLVIMYEQTPAIEPLR